MPVKTALFRHEHHGDVMFVEMYLDMKHHGDVMFVEM